ncbi:condensin complex subunit 1 [Palaemon carinicauda]|uniref:condensin complex subunit 1 n=1 Tax=Palaemon carinicauda TaxID=392227 RepID=UPI0035B6664A
MESFDFVIPLSLDALQEASSTRQYAVTYVTSSRELPKKVVDSALSFRKCGSNFILQEQNFDTLYSVLVNFKSVDEECQRRSWDLVLKAMTKLASEISPVVEGNDMSSSERLTWLNIVKMTTYIACTLTEAFEKHSNKPSLDTALATKGRKKSAKKLEDERDWEQDRNQMLNQLYGLIQHPLQRLWDPPIMEEDFVNLIANCCYKILESPNMNQVKTKSTRDSVFQVIGSLVKRFNHGLACSLKLMQLLQHFEHMVTPAAQGIILLIQCYDNKNVMSEMIREITKTDAKELMKDTSGLRNFSQFLVEVAEKCPQVVMPSLSLLINFLDEEAYVMRNCVLSILGSVVLKVLSGDDLEDKNKDLRDQCLDHLEEHIHDIHAFVRSKVLQIWNDLITEKAVPLRRQQHILRLVLGRLKDRSSTVRKNAVQLLTAFLKGNPFAAKLPLEDLQSQFEIELKKLKEMDPNASEDPEAEKPREKVLSPADKWEAKLPEIVDFIEEVVKEGGTDDDDDDDGEDVLDEESSLNDAVLEVASAMNKNNIRRAIKLLEAALNLFQGAEILSYDPEQAFQTNTDIDTTSFSSRQMHILVVLKRVFISSKSMELRNSQGKDDDKEGEDCEEEDEEEEVEKENPEVTKQKLLVAYLKDSVGFAKLINIGIPVVCQLLGSKQVSDVMEAISFFVTAFEFGLLNAKAGVLKMLVLIWSKEPAIKDAVVEAYQRLYINTDISNDRARSQLIVRNLSALITGCTLGERTSLEEIVSQFVNSGDINKHCITLMWEKFTKTLPDTTDDEARAALVLLAMCANSEVSIISSNISVLVKSGLGKRGEKDFALVKETCSALLKLAETKPKTDSPNASFRLEQHHEIFGSLANILVNGLTRLEDQQYCPMAIEAVSTIYSLAEHPDIICGEVIQKMARIMQEQATESEEVNPEDSASQFQSLLQVPVGIVTRFIVVVGQVALCQLVHLDTYIFSELKRRNFLKEEMENEKKSKKSRKSHRKSLITSASEASMSKSEPDIDEDMELTGAVADDMEAEYIRSICESEILKGENLLDLIRPTILAICSNPVKYTNPDLRAAATLSLSKMMMVSTELCEDNLQLLFTILEKSEEAVIRANVVIALGDLSFRFPNLLEPWTPRIYARLRDYSPKVRQNTLTILTHLILNDMVKVKGQISDIALCITDEDPRISGLANLFFTELARKGNALYNVLPDIISRLSDTELDLEEQKYRTIIGPIFALLQKDKQLETLAEKLCHRFQATKTPRQWRDVAYCLSLLQYNEKSVRKLSESFAFYGDKLHEPEVFEFFLGILANARKNSRPEAKAQIDELEARIQENHDKGVEDENALSNAANAKSKAKQSHKPVTKKKKVRLQVADSSSEDEGGMESDEDFSSEPPRTQKIDKESHRPRRSSTRASRR